MATRLLLPIILLTSALNASAQQIANGGFEDWTDQFLFSQLDEWTTSNWSYPGIANVTQVPSAPGWANAARLETNIIGNDTIFGLIMHGSIVDDAPASGVPFTTEVTDVQGWYRCGLQPNDSALIVVGIWANGILMSFDVNTIGGSQAAWSTFTFPLNMGDPIVPDSVLVAVLSSNPFAPDYIQDGSWIAVDGIGLISASVPVPDMLPNADMEFWHDITVEEPDEWGTFNAPLAGIGLTPVTKSDLAHSGAHSARLETMSLGADTLPGVLSNSTLSLIGAVAGEPFSETPLTLDGWFMYEPVGTDTGAVFAQFSWNNLPVGGASQGFHGTGPQWMPFSAPVDLLLTPDTLVLVVFSGDNPGSVLYLDDIHFDGLFSEVHYLDHEAAFLFPNPANDLVSVHIPADMRSMGRLRVIDLQGRVIVERPTNEMGGSTMRLPVSELPPGRYVIELISAKRTERLGFVRQ